MQKMKKLSFILVHVLMFSWMAFIFYMSAQPGEVSSDISGSVSHVFMKIWNVVFFQGWNEAQVLQMAEIWDYPIRKLAHMTEFGILAMLVYFVLRQYSEFLRELESKQSGIYESISKFIVRIRTWFPTHRRFILAWAVTVIYAATDEIHQLFVPQRSGNGFDVCVDATGAFLALLVIWGVVRMIQNYESKKACK